jgi:hypothetical protein
MQVDSTGLINLISHLRLRRNVHVTAYLYFCPETSLPSDPEMLHDLMYSYPIWWLTGKVTFLITMWEEFESMYRVKKEGRFLEEVWEHAKLPSMRCDRLSALQQDRAWRVLVDAIRAAVTDVDDRLDLNPWDLIGQALRYLNRLFKERDARGAWPASADPISVPWFKRATTTVRNKASIFYRKHRQKMVSPLHLLEAMFSSYFLRFLH